MDEGTNQLPIRRKAIVPENSNALLQRGITQKWVNESNGAPKVPSCQCLSHVGREGFEVLAVRRRRILSAQRDE